MKNKKEASKKHTLKVNILKTRKALLETNKALTGE